jgi:putative methyltransferase (TIGR04325 family)
MTLRAFIKLLTPPLLVQAYRLSRRTIGNESNGISGNYQSWDEARRVSTGYDSYMILEKTAKALLQVKNGRAVYERDSVLFDEIRYAWPVLAALLSVAAQCRGRLNVLDFGGSLGSTYFQNRNFLRRLPEVRWNVVEQSKHVETGKKLFEDDHLKFYFNVDDCMAATDPNVVILSSVLQYLEHPYHVLAKLSALPCNHIVIDRTPFWLGATDRLCVQRVPASIYRASYPIWIFSAERFLSHLDRCWEVVAEFDSLDKLNGPVDLTYKGMMISRKIAVDRLVDRA